ncbi:MAG: leucine-rich repeat protein [Ruminococcus sp.]|nr:leucine-rich repeat protein [Ruminococcus sp.]
MKKLISVFCAILVLVCMVPVITAFSADTDFVIEDGVLTNYVGEDKNVVIPSSVRVISYRAFAGNKNIESVKFSDELYSIGDEAFYGCTSLKSIENADSVRYVGALSFVDTPFLSEATDEFVTLGSVLLHYNGASSNVTIPDGISVISAYAFLSNTSINSVNCESITHIGEGAFYGCTALSDVISTKELVYVGPDAFYNTAWLNAQSDFVTLGDGLLVAYKGSGADVVIPENVKRIAPNSFYTNKSIKTVEIPSSVFDIGARAFMGCSALSDVEFNSGLVMIDDEAFAQCSSLKVLTTPNTLSKIGKGAFAQCAGISIAFVDGDSLLIDYGAFAQCSSLESVLLSNNVHAVGSDTFFECNNLQYVNVSEDTIGISANTFAQCNNVTVICKEDSFANSTLLGKVNISNNVGDSNLDGEVSVMDATLIQRYVAGITQPSNQSVAFCDANFDANVSIIDATSVQRIVAKLD